MLKQRYFRRAIAIEPSADTFALLQRNILQNGLTGSIDAHCCAVSDTPGEMFLELSENNTGDHRLRTAAALPGRLGEEHRQTVRVSVQRLDDLLADPVQRARIGLIWVDIQGHEGQFFDGAREILASGAPVVSEFWPYGIRRAGFDAA